MSNEVQSSAVAGPAAPVHVVALSEADQQLPPFSARLMIGLTLVQLALAIAVPRLGSLFGCGLAITMVWLARPEYLGPLLINQLTGAEIQFGSWRGSEGTLIVAGFPLNVSYMVALTLAARVSWEIVRRPGTFRGTRWLLLLWYVAMIPATIMAVMGKLEKNPSWTGPIRDVWICGTYFYGFILARRWRSDATAITGSLLPVTNFLLLLATLGVFNHKSIFILVPLSVPMAWCAWQQRRRMARLQAVFGLMMAASVGLGLRVIPAIPMPTEGDAPMVENLGLGGSTITFNGLMLLALGLTILLAVGSGWMRRIAAVGFGMPAFVFVVVFSISVAVLGPRYWGTDPLGSTRDRPLSERIREKLFDDRSVIWNTALNDSLEPPLLFKASGSPLIIDHESWGEIVWTAGAHNAVLNTLSRQRWFNGVIILVMLATAMTRNAAGLARALPEGVSSLAIAAAVTGIVGVAVADYPANSEGGFWFFGFAGVVAGCVQISRRLALTVDSFSPR